MGTNAFVPGPRTLARGFRYRLRPLAAALALAGFCAHAVANPVTHIVNTCADPPGAVLCGADDGTLRQAVACALDGDVVDASQLQCSTITLSSPLIVPKLGLTIAGPGRKSLTIDAGDQFRTVIHNGNPGDTLTMRDLSIAHGHFTNTYTYGGGGGCIFSSGNVYLESVDVHDCYLAATQIVASGAGIFANGDVKLVASAVTYSSVRGLAPGLKYEAARGGGIYAQSVELDASTISGNLADTTQNNPTYGGGVYARYFVANYSTIAYNTATERAGVSAAESFRLVDSTISSNTASNADGAARILNGIAYLYNSTVALNSADKAGAVGGISSVSLFMESTIVARNTATSVEADVGAGAGGIGGGRNLIMAANAPLPVDTITDDPLLGPLQDNGGPSATHALLRGSPAIDNGTNPLQLAFDQSDMTRVQGVAADIGSFEVEASLFSSGFETLVE